MGTLHDLIEAKGKAGTLAFDFNRQVVEAAAAYRNGCTSIANSRDNLRRNSNDSPPDIHSPCT